MSEMLEGVYAAFVNNLIPQVWMSKSYPSLKCLSSFIHDLELRLDMIEVLDAVNSIYTEISLKSVLELVQQWGSK